jgi:outer membrane protein assembly factor BamB
VVTSAIGIVHALGAADGRLLWSSDLAVHRTRQLLVRDDRVYALAGGPYVFWGGRAGLALRDSSRTGLYCLSLEDGQPVAGFAGPWNPNRIVRSLDLSQVEGWDEDDSWEREEDWADEDAKARAAGTYAHSERPLIGMAATGAGLLVATESEVALLDYATGAMLATIELGDLGPAALVVVAGNRVLVRTGEGLAGFDAASGEEVFRRRTGRWEKVAGWADPGHVPFLDVPRWTTFTTIELAARGSQLLWLDEDGRLAVVPAAGGGLVGLSLTDGAPQWELAAPPFVVKEGSSLLFVDQGGVEVHRLGPRPIPDAEVVPVGQREGAGG